MSSLYEITGAYKDLQERFDAYVDAVASGEIPEDAIWDTLDAIDGEFDEKVDNMACIYKETMYSVAAKKAEIDSMKKRMDAEKAAAERLMKYIAVSMQALGKQKVETTRNKISFRKSEKVLIDDVDGFVQWAQEYNPDLLSYKTPEPNKTVIKQIIASGQQIEGCRIEQCQNIQIK